MNVTESNAVLTVLHWLGAHPIQVVAELPTAADLSDALEVLGQRAGRTLQISVRPIDVALAIERLTGRLAAADSDGAAQAVCRALAAHVSHGGSIPWPSISGPFEDWSKAHAAAGGEGTQP